MLYINLKTEIVKRHISIDALAQDMHISSQGLIDRIHGLKEFTLSEVHVILSVFPDLEFGYLFERV